MGKILLRTLLAAVAIALLYGIYYAWNALPVYTGYSAKIICSCTFVSGREEMSILKEDLSSFGLADISVNYLDSTVVSSVIGLAARTAVYRKGLGCTLALGKTVEEVKAEQEIIIKPDQRQANNYWPTGDNFAGGEFPREMNEDALERAMDNIFNEPDLKRIKGTRAVVVVYRGKIVAERYAEGFSRAMPLLGWSMTKSVVNAMVGI